MERASVLDDTDQLKPVLRGGMDQIVESGLWPDHRDSLQPLSPATRELSRQLRRANDEIRALEG